MNGPTAIWGSPKLWVVAGLITIVAAAVVFYVFDPETAGFYPVCAVHRMTGLQCPGCGSLRALHQLAHGNIAAAWRYNPLLIALLPAAVWLGMREAVHWTFGWRWPGVVNCPVFGWAVVVVAIIFGIVRNLPLK